MENGETQAPITNGTSNSETKTKASVTEPPQLTARQAELITQTWGMVKEIGLETAGSILFVK